MSLLTIDPSTIYWLSDLLSRLLSHFGLFVFIFTRGRSLILGWFYMELQESMVVKYLLEIKIKLSFQSDSVPATNWIVSLGNEGLCRWRFERVRFPINSFFTEFVWNIIWILFPFPDKS